jgi:deoxycytidylate deaminase
MSSMEDPTDPPTWDAYFYKIAEAVAEKSKDSCPVGAVIVRPDGHVILATGYNGPARGVLEPARAPRHAGRKTALDLPR